MAGEIVCPSSFGWSRRGGKDSPTVRSCVVNKRMKEVMVTAEQPDVARRFASANLVGADLEILYD